MNISRIGKRLAFVLLFALLLGYTLLTLGPFIWAAVLSLRSTNQIMDNPYGITWPPYFNNYIFAFTKFGFLHYTWNSILVTGASLIITTLVSSMAAFAFARRRYYFRLRTPTFYLIFVSIMFPPQITLLALFQILVKYKLYNTLWGLILVYSASALPLTIYILRSFFVQIPTELEDACRIDGCNDWQLFWKVMFPIARPAVSTTVIYNFIIFWNEFLYAVTFITKQEARTLPLAVMFFIGESTIDLGMLAAGLMVSIIPVLILYLIMSEQFIKGMTVGALKG